MRKIVYKLSKFEQHIKFYRPHTVCYIRVTGFCNSFTSPNDQTTIFSIQIDSVI